MRGRLHCAALPCTAQNSLDSLGREKRGRDSKPTLGSYLGRLAKWLFLYLSGHMRQFSTPDNNKMFSFNSRFRSNLGQENPLYLAAQYGTFTHCLCYLHQTNTEQTPSRHRAETKQTQRRHHGDTNHTPSRQGALTKQTQCRHQAHTRQTLSRNQPDIKKTPCRNQADTRQTPSRHRGDTEQTANIQKSTHEADTVQTPSKYRGDTQ